MTTTAMILMSFWGHWAPAIGGKEEEKKEKVKAKSEVRQEPDDNHSDDSDEYWGALGAGHWRQHQEGEAGIVINSSARDVAIIIEGSAADAASATIAPCHEDEDEVEPAIGDKNAIATGKATAITPSHGEEDGGEPTLDHWHGTEKWAAHWRASPLDEEIG